MKLSSNLSLKEVVKSNTAENRDIDNTPELEHLYNLIAIANAVFQPLRSHFNLPIGITSGYRSEDLNKAIGGSSSSQHCKGEALDIDADLHGKITNEQIFYFIKDNLMFDQLIAEFEDNNQPKWIHVSYTRESNRKQVLIATKKYGKTEYLSYTPELYKNIYKS